jgi:hypothetical protein
MPNQVFFGIGIFFWLLGTVTNFFARGEETMKRPRWASLLLLNFQQVTPVATVFLQAWGMLIIFYGLFVAEFIPDPLIKMLVGILGPVILTRVFIEILENVN